MTLEQAALVDAQATYDQLHAAWSEASMARRAGEQRARQAPTVVDQATGRLVEAQYTPGYAGEIRRLKQAEGVAWGAMRAAGEVVVLARQSAAAADARARRLAALAPMPAAAATIEGEGRVPNDW